MKVELYLCLLGAVGFVSCGVLPQIPIAVTTSQQIGGRFAYSTVESRAISPNTPTTAISYISSVPVTYSTAFSSQPTFSQSIFGSPFYPIISSPFYPGIAGQAPVISQNPVFGGQYPIFGLPGQGQAPIQAPPVAAPPQGVPQGPAPPPPGAVVDDDTVSVESA